MRSIVLGSVRFSDSGKMVRLFTEDQGLRSFPVMGLGSSNKGRAPMFQPMSLITAEEENAKIGKLPRLTGVQRAYIFQNLYTDPIKSTIAFFCAEVTERAVVEGQANVELFDFCWHAMQWLDLDSEVTLFPVFWSLNIMRYCGVYPGSDGEGKYYDLREAKWTNAMPGHSDMLDRDNALLWLRLQHHDFESVRSIGMSSAQRRLMLNAAITFLHCHVIGAKELKSVEVLREVFS